MNVYYVYALIDPTDNNIFYIGKGKGDRYLQHVKQFTKLGKDNILLKRGMNPSKIKKIETIISSGLEVVHKIIAANLSEESAYALEEILVERFGREIMKTGNLTNLEPGGKWVYPKLELEEAEKTTMKVVEERFPELLEILAEYPHIAKERPVNTPWFKQKIPKEFAVFQYSIEGVYLATHHSRIMTYVTGMSERMIKDAINRNQGYIYDSQWSLAKLDQMRNLAFLDQTEFETLKEYDRPFYRQEILLLDQVEEYASRIQEVEDDLDS